MYRIGISTGPVNLDDSIFKEYQKAGIEYMEISTSYEVCNTLDWKEYKKIAKSYGVNIWSFHLPFKPFEVIDMSSSDKEKRAFSVNYYAELIKRNADIGVDKFVLHSGGKVTRQSQTEIDVRIECAMESYAKLAELASSEGAAIAAENLPPVCVGTNIDEMARLLSADSRLKLCFDTNHLLSGEPTEFIKTFGDRLLTIHVSDYDRINERHWLPGEGVNNWYDIYDTLKSVGYDGVWMYEVGLGFSPTIERKRPLTAKDIVQNANEIFNHKELTYFQDF